MEVGVSSEQEVESKGEVGGPVSHSELPHSVYALEELIEKCFVSLGKCEE